MENLEKSDVVSKSGVFVLKMVITGRNDNFGSENETNA